MSDTCVFYEVDLSTTYYAVDLEQPAGISDESYMQYDLSPIGAEDAHTMKWDLCWPPITIEPLTIDGEPLTIDGEPLYAVIED